MTLENQKRQKIIIDMHEKGLSYRDIGKAFKISRQRVHQIWKYIPPSPLPQPC